MFRSSRKLKLTRIDPDTSRLDDWLLTPSRMALAGGCIVFLICGAGFYLLQIDLSHRPAASWPDVLACGVVGTLAATPFVAVALLVGRTSLGRRLVPAGATRTSLG
jgi:hypothetical protein